MTESTQFIIGCEVSFADGGHGRLTRVVLDPVARAMTHLVVDPEDRPGQVRLVPIGLVVSVDRAIRLSCTTAEFDRLEGANDSHFLPRAPASLGYGEHQLLSWPYFNLGGGVGGFGLGRRPRPHPIVRDRVPVGEVEVRRGVRVYATDGPIGRVQGLVVDPRDHQVTHVLLDEGHLWGERRVAIPIRSVAGINDGVRLSLTTHEVRDLPPVDLAAV